MLESQAIRTVSSKKDPSRPLAVLMCGTAGSGKTTLSKKLEMEGFTRFSIDEEVWVNFGRYGIDYPAEEYRANLDKAHIILFEKMLKQIKAGGDIVVDSSFWRRSERNRYKQAVEDAGGISQIIYLKVEQDVLYERVRIRNSRFDANAAFPITREVLTSFINSFEVPAGEGELVIDQ
ncbi:AAA family ATPase [Peribacillus sp. SCS-26]|uniref:AAA family ATPase n=1 Tax=Paraperibacillus marinus TaxID=3115295 RepID=UPI00390684FE